MTAEWVDKNGKQISPDLHNQNKIELLNAKMEKIPQPERISKTI